MTNDEARNKSEGRSTNSDARAGFGFRHSAFFRISTFVIKRTHRLNLNLFDLGDLGKVSRCDPWNFHSKSLASLGVGLWVLDAHWPFLCQPVLFVEFQGWTACHVGAGGGLVAGGLVCMGGDVAADCPTGAAVSIRRREMGPQCGRAPGGQRDLLAGLHGAARLGGAGAKLAGRFAGFV